MPEDSAVPSNTESAEEKPCSSSAADSTGDVMEEARKLLGKGNKHLIMGDVVSAVNVFQEACAMLAEKYGDTADECGEAFFLCGKALLELARMENTVLGNALEGVPEEDSEEGDNMNNSKTESADNLDEKTRDELRVQVYEAMAENDTPERNNEGKGESEQGVHVAEEKGTAESGMNEAEDEKVSPELVDKAENRVASSDAQNGKGLGVSTLDEETSELREELEEGEDDDDDDDSDEGEGPGDSKESEEEVGNLQLAWEMLEVAKVIYKRKETKEDQLMAAQAYLKLGEVGAESGNYAQALEDFQECLALQLKYLPPHSRLLAETHYQLGVTFGYTNHYTQALQHFSSSIKVIESRMALLQEAIDKADGEDGAAEEKQEMEELMELLPDIREKVEDTKESQKTAAEASLAIQQTLGGASTSSGFPGNSEMSASAVSQIPVKPSDEASSKSASDISHLVRKKRKPEEENPVKESDAKKVKHEATVNGSGDSASNGNGVQEKMEQEETEKQSAPVESSS